jgi:hypothetical protein
MLHAGSVDLILLGALTTGAVFQGLSFKFDAARHLSLGVLVQIWQFAGDRALAKQYVCGLDHTDIQDALCCCLLRPSGLANQFPFGGMPRSCGGIRIPAHEFMDMFAISFWIRNDASVLLGLSDQIPLIRFVDSKRNVLSLFAAEQRAVGHLRRPKRADGRLAVSADDFESVDALHVLLSEQARQ